MAASAAAANLSQKLEPGTGANAGRFPQTACDANRALSQVRGSPADSLGPGQMGRSCLGVKGSRAQIPPSRLVRGLKGLSKRSSGAQGFSDQAYAGSSAFAFKMRFMAVAPLVRAGRISVPVHRLGDRRAAVPHQIADVLQADIVR